VQGAEINRDSNLRLQYLAGLGYNESLGTEIRDELLTYRTFPHRLVHGIAGERRTPQRTGHGPIGAQGSFANQRSWHTMWIPPLKRPQEETMTPLKAG